MDFEQIKENWKNLPQSYREKHFFCSVCNEVREKSGRKILELTNNKNIMVCEKCQTSGRFLKYMMKNKVRIKEKEKKKEQHKFKSKDNVITIGDFMGPKFKKYVKEISCQEQ